MTRRLPPPWRTEKFSGGYVVRDANGFAVAYAGKNLRGVLFYFLAAATSVPELAPVQLIVYEFEIDGKLRGKAGDVRKQRLSV